MMLTRTQVSKSITLLLAMLATSTAYAGFDTYSTDWPNNSVLLEENVTPPASIMIVEQPSPECYNSAKNVRIPEIQRMYVKFGANQGPTQIAHIRNRSIGIFQNLTVATYSIKKVGIDWELGVGTKVNKMIRFEVEYLYNKTINYNPAPVFSGNATILTSQIKNQSLLVDMYVDFDKVDYFRPYIGVLTGFVWNKTRSSLTGGTLNSSAAENQNHYSWTWGATIGARMPFWTRFFGYFAYRYIGPSKIYWKDSSSTMKLQGQYIFSGFTFGVEALI